MIKARENARYFLIIIIFTGLGLWENANKLMLSKCVSQAFEFSMGSYSLSIAETKNRFGYNEAAQP